MYHYADRPGQSTERSRQAIARDYNTTIYGLPGNDGTSARSPTPLRGTQADAASRFGSYGKLCRVLPPRHVPASWHTPDAHLISVLLAYNVRIHNPVFRKTTTINAIGFEGNPMNGTGGKIYVKVSDVS